MTTKKQQVLNHLLTGRTITQGEAIVLGYGTRLADLIFRLKRDGHQVVTRLKRDIHGTEYAEYSLIRKKVAA